MNSDDTKQAQERVRRFIHDTFASDIGLLVRNAVIVEKKSVEEACDSLELLILTYCEELKVITAEKLGSGQGDVGIGLTEQALLEVVAELRSQRIT